MQIDSTDIQTDGFYFPHDHCEASTHHLKDSNFFVMIFGVIKTTMKFS